MAKNHYIVKRKGGGGGIEYICFQSSLILQFLDTIGFNSTNKSCQESRQVNNPAPSTASIKIKMMKFVVTTLLIAALPFFAYGQISNFKKVKKFGSTWIQKEQVIKPGRSVLLPANSFVSEIKEGSASMARVGGLIQVIPEGVKGVKIIWCSLLKESQKKEVFYSKELKPFSRKP